MMKVVKTLEEYGLLIKVVCETVKTELKEKKGKYLHTLTAPKNMAK